MHSDRDKNEIGVLLMYVSKYKKHIITISCFVAVFMLGSLQQGLIAQSDFDSKSVQVEEVNLKVFPNPTSDYIHLSFDSELNGHYKLSNIFGKIILEGKLTKEGKTIDLLDYRTGIYIVSVFNSEGKKVGARKIIKN